MIYTIIRGDTTTITLDCVQQFSESHTATATQHPVETGSAITDHVFLNNTELSMKGVVSDFSPSPEYVTMSKLGSAGVDSGSRSHTTEIKELLMSIFKGREVVTVQVSIASLHIFNQFERCVLTSISFSDDPESGEAIYPDLKFAQIRTVSRSTRQEKAVTGFLKTKVQEDEEAMVEVNEAANKTNAAAKKPQTPLELEQLKTLAQLRTGSRIAEIVLNHPELSYPQAIAISAKESGQTITNAGTVTAGWNAKSFIGTPIAIPERTISTEEAARTRAAILQIEIKNKADKRLKDLLATQDGQRIAPFILGDEPLL